MTRNICLQEPHSENGDCQSHIPASENGTRRMPPLGKAKPGACALCGCGDVDPRAGMVVDVSRLLTSPGFWRHLCWERNATAAWFTPVLGLAMQRKRHLLCGSCRQMFAQDRKWVELLGLDGRERTVRRQGESLRRGNRGWKGVQAFYGGMALFRVRRVSSAPHYTHPDRNANRTRDISIDGGPFGTCVEGVSCAQKALNKPLRVN